MTIVASLMKRIAKLRRLERKCFLSRRRFGFYRYLSGLLDYYQELERAGRLIYARDLLLREERFACASTNPIRVLIDATSSADAKTKSRWTRALQYVLDHRESWVLGSSLKSFFRKNGGVSGCARLGAARRCRKTSIVKPVEVPEFRDWR